MSRTSKARMREVFAKKGFDFANEFMKALQHVDDRTRLEALVSVAPYFMERLRPEAEVEQVPAKDVTPKAIEASNDDLTALITHGTDRKADQG